MTNIDSSKTLFINGQYFKVQNSTDAMNCVVKRIFCKQERKLEQINVCEVFRLLRLLLKYFFPGRTPKYSFRIPLITLSSNCFQQMGSQFKLIARGKSGLGHPDRKLCTTSKSATK